MLRDELSAGIEYLQVTANSLKLSVVRADWTPSCGLLNVDFARSDVTSPERPRAVGFLLSREFLEDLPATKEYKTALAHFLQSLSLRLVQHSPTQFMTLSGRPIDLEIHWPFRSAQDSDSDAVHVLLRTGSRWSSEASISVRIWGPDLLGMGIPSLSPPTVESLVVNSIRISVDRGLLHFHPNGTRPADLDQVTCAPELFRRSALSDSEIGEFIQRKVYWLGFRQGDEDTGVPIVDPYESPYLGCDGQRLRQIAKILVAKGAIALDASGQFAHATDQLLRRSDEFEDGLQPFSSSRRPETTKSVMSKDVDGNDAQTPRVFISYSWDSAAHKQWVLDLATKLRRDGIDAVLDQTHLLLGARNPEFMECSVRNSTDVLVICTETYKRRFDDRKGGAGYEGHIITGEIISEVGKNKFIPVLRTGDWTSSLPTALAGTNGVDFRADSEQEYQRLIKRLHRVSDIPPLGSRPQWLAADLSKSPNGTLSSQLAVPPSSLSSSASNGFRPKEIELLWNCARDPAGQLVHSVTLAGEEIRVNGRDVLERADVRSAAEWAGALRTLEMRGLVERIDRDGVFFKLTSAGYEASDGLQEFARWNAQTVLLRANFLAAPAEERRLDCKGVIAVPTTYFDDLVGADGSVMRSVREPRSLLIEGISSKPTDNWIPTDVEFVDAETGVTERFQVHGMQFVEPASLKLPIVS